MLPRIEVRSPLPPQFVTMLASMVLLSGCDLQTFVGAREKMWFWLLIPLAGFLLVGSAWIFSARSRQLKAWDLQVSPTEPSSNSLVLRTCVVALVLAGVFTGLNFYVDIDGQQALYNSGLWFLGSILGAAIALFLGMRLAERQAS